MERYLQQKIVFAILIKQLVNFVWIILLQYGAELCPKSRGYNNFRYHLITHFNTNILITFTRSLVIYYNNLNITDTSTSFSITNLLNLVLFQVQTQPSLVMTSRWEGVANDRGFLNNFLRSLRIPVLVNHPMAEQQDKPITVSSLLTS